MTQILDTSEAGICNEALSIIRDAGSITSLEQPNSQRARVCRTHFAAVRDGLLRKYAFNFAMQWATITEAPGSPPPSWASHYGLPGLFLRAVRVKGLVKREWTIEGDKRLLANTTGPLDLHHSQRVAEPHKWDPLFRSMMVHALAVRIAGPLAKSQQVINNAKMEFDRIEQDARTIDSYEKDHDHGDDERDYLSSYLLVRQ